MIHLGYDFYEYGSIQKPNGLISQTINQSNRDTSIIFHLAILQLLHLCNYNITLI